MSRQIKFRVWDGINKQFAWHGYAIGQGGFLFKMDGRITPEEERNLMYSQFTGLIDKNGKEIYEGDIVETFGSGEHGAVKLGQFFFNDSSQIGADNSQAVGWFVDFGTRKEALVGDGNIVLGNIYENPELIEEAKPGE